MANLIFTLLEIVSVVIYAIYGFSAIMESFMELDFEGMFESVDTSIWILSGAVLFYSLIFLFFKRLRTPYVKGVAISNLVWVAFNIFGLLF